MSEPWYAAIRKLRPATGEKWRAYVERSGLTHLDELITLDWYLCPAVLGYTDDYRPYVADERYYCWYFTDLAFLERELAGMAGMGDVADLAGADEWRLLCVYLNPEALPDAPAPFRFVGYDLVEAATGISALTNGGGWPELDTAELSANGLLSSHGRAIELQALLKRAYPHVHEANCDVWAIFA